MLHFCPVNKRCDRISVPSYLRLFFAIRRRCGSSVWFLRRFMLLFCLVIKHCDRILVPSYPRPFFALRRCCRSSVWVRTFCSNRLVSGDLVLFVVGEFAFVAKAAFPVWPKFTRLWITSSDRMFAAPSWNVRSTTTSRNCLTKSWSHPVLPEVSRDRVALWVG